MTSTHPIAHSLRLQATRRSIHDNVREVMQGAADEIDRLAQENRDLKEKLGRLEVERAVPCEVTLAQAIDEATAEVPEDASPAPMTSAEEAWRQVAEHAQGERYMLALTVERLRAERKDMLKRMSKIIKRFQHDDE